MIAAVAQDAPLEQLTRDMDSEIKRLQTELISEKEYEKLLNSFETSFIANNFRCKRNSLLLGCGLYFLQGYQPY